MTTFEVEIDGNAGAGVAGGNDILNVAMTGAVNLGGATLDLVLGYVPAFGQSFTIIDNATATPVTNTFAGRDEGEVFTDGGVMFQITYQGGDGNDVVLTVLDPSNPALAGTPDDDVLTAEHNGTDVDIYLNGNLVHTVAVNIPLSLSGLTGNDSLTLDFTNGVFGPVSFDGNEGNENGMATNWSSTATASRRSITTPRATAPARSRSPAPMPW